MMRFPDASATILALLGVATIAALLNASPAHSTAAPGGAVAQTLLPIADGIGGAGHHFGESIAIDNDRMLIAACGCSNRQGFAFIYELSDGVWSRVAELQPGDRRLGDDFGSTVALSGHLALVGAPAHARTSRMSGSVFAFRLVDGDWSLLGELRAPEGHHEFGTSLAIEGSRALIGANRGVVFVYEFASDEWIRSHDLISGDVGHHDFGASVAVAKDMAFVSYPAAGLIYVFEKASETWALQSQISANLSFSRPDMVLTQDQLIVATGRTASVYAKDGDSWSLVQTLTSEALDLTGIRALDADAYQLVIGASRSEVYLFDGERWGLEGTIESPDDDVRSFGTAVGISGEAVVIGDPRYSRFAGAAYAYERMSGQWVQTQHFVEQDRAIHDQFGSGVAVDGVNLVVGAPGDDPPSAYHFVHDGFRWQQIQKFEPPERTNGFGSPVAIDGTRLAVGSRDFYPDNVFLYELDQNEWTLRQTLSEPHIEFGHDVGMDAEFLLIGAPGSSEMGHDAGAVYVFKWDGFVWQSSGTIFANNARSFGTSVSILGRRAVIGAQNRAYVFELTGDDWLLTQELIPISDSPLYRFGFSVDQTASEIVVGSVNDHSSDAAVAYFFRNDGGDWIQTQAFGEGLPFHARAVSIGDELAAISVEGKGVGLDERVLFLRRNEGEWSLTKEYENEFRAAASALWVEGGVAFLGLPGASSVDFSSGAVVVYNPDFFAVSGTASRVAYGESLEIENRGQTIEVGNGPFLFEGQPDHTPYDVQIVRSPPGQSCFVSHGAGEIDGAHVSEVEVVCGFQVAVEVDGLRGSGLVLQLNHEVMQVSANGRFTFQQINLSGEAYAVSIAGQPDSPDQACDLRNGEGVVRGGETVEVVCGFAVGGVVVGLEGDALELELNGRHRQLITQPGQFRFGVPLASETQYFLAISRLPRGPRQDCDLSLASGVIRNISQTNLIVDCRTRSFSIGGTVYDLEGGGLVLRNNEMTLAIDQDGPFRFTDQPDASGFNVTVESQPREPDQNCRIKFGSGHLNGADIHSVRVDCGIPQLLNDGFESADRTKGQH